MRHRVGGYKLGRNTSHRKAVLRNLVTALFKHERIVTTPAKAKAAKSLAEKLITAARTGTLAARRNALKVLYEKDVVKKLFDEIAPRYADRTGGYTRILRRVRGLGKNRLGDNAETCIFELVGQEAEREKADKEKLQAKKKEKEKTS
ncbi:MAG TPA: 50S ribosomal protein L17 [Planctomycetota bacterium]|nr:50S ribosomal protein L17 [Planctomycetota bacterium]